MKRIKINNKKRFYTILIILVTISVLVGYFLYYFNQINNPQNLFDSEDNSFQNKNPFDQININKEFSKNKINILLFGLDKNYTRENVQGYNIYRSDTIMVVTIDIVEKTVDIVSIPRDTYVPIYDRKGKDKINTCFYYGRLYGKDDDFTDGVKYLSGTVSNVLGDIPINYYVGITDMDVVTKIIDAIDGVDIDVLHTLYANKGHDKSKVEVSKGQQRLNGEELLYYARYRMYPMGDIDRVKNQQHIIKNIFNNFKKSDKILKIPEIYKILSENIATNLSFKQISALALLGLDIDMASIETYTLPGTFGDLGGLSYWIINQKERVELIETVYGLKAKKWTQDPTSDKLEQLFVNSDTSMLEVGQGGMLTITGKTADNREPSFTVSETNLNMSQEGILQVNADNSIVALSPGTVTLTFGVDGISDSVTITVSSPIKEDDTTAPVIYGAEDLTINMGEEFNIYDGIEVYDEDENVTLTVEGNVDINTPDKYILIYKAIDSSGNEKIIKRTITVVDNSNNEEDENDDIAPVISGIDDITIDVGEEFHPFTGVSVYDEDENVTLDVSGEVDNNTPGVYKLTYTAIDSSGNRTDIIRIVTVREVESPSDDNDSSNEE